MTQHLRRWKRAALAGLCLLALFASGCHPGDAARDQSPDHTVLPPTPTPGGPSSSTAAGRQPENACRGAGAAGVGVFRETSPAELDSFERWLGCRVDYAIDFSARDSWADIESPTYLLEAWKGQPRRLVLGVAMLPSQGDDSIENGARGDYDDHYRRLAHELVAGGHGDAILRVGWEFNLPGSRWYTQDYTAFSTYWRRIVQAMEAQPGASFRFDWNVNNGAGSVDATNYYPGDDVVDYIGVDAYDVTSKVYPYPDGCDPTCRAAVQDQAWQVAIFGGPRSLSFWSTFARQHRKPLSLPEWGLWGSADGIGGGDSPTYVRRMHEFIVDPANGVAYQGYFEHDGAAAQHRLAAFPESGEVYRSVFNAG